MTGSLLVLLLAGQVLANDPYGTAAQSQVDATNQSASQTGEGLVPMLQSPPTDSGSSPGATPSSRSNDVYGTSAGDTTGSVGDNQSSPPFRDPASSPDASSPPGFRDFRSQAPPPAAATSPAGAAPAKKPSALMRSILTPPAASRLSGQAVTLADVVAGANSRGEQSQRIDAYWDLCSSVADYYLSLGEQDELHRLQSTTPRMGTAWEQAAKELTTRIGTSERAARASQLRLSSWLGGSLPLPGDMPHCGSYKSRYDEIFAGRPSAEAQELSALLPLHYAELKDAALAVARAEEWLNAIESVRNENSDGTGTLRALELWALRRRAFIQIARDYNHRIARYCELATPGAIPAERLVSMLILRDNSSTATRASNQASSLNRQSNNGDRTVPQTFSGGWSPAAPPPTASTRDEAVQPATGESENSPRRERSLLVKPK